MRTPSGSLEPTISNWSVVPAGDFLARLPAAAAAKTRIIAVDGRSGAGKSTLAEKLHLLIHSSFVLSTDDVAWNFSMFDWADVLAEHVIDPVRDGRSVSYQPPGWLAHGRTGSITIPAGRHTLIIEGVGAGQRALRHLLDAVIWVQSDRDAARTQGIARDVALGQHGGRTESEAFWDEWMTAELPFLEDQQTWARADFIVGGTGSSSVTEDRIAVAD